MAGATGERRPLRVEMRAVSKRFGETAALREVDFTLERGEIHGLLGENGAGKTTLMNVLSGLYRADAGTIVLDGRRVDLHSPADALRHGVGMVHQHVELIPSFTALENILLGAENTTWWLRLDRQRGAVEAIARRFGLPIELDALAGGLAAGVQQKVEILKALFRGVEVLILDEPTTMLTPQEVDGLFGTLRSLAGEGLTIVFISHKIREIEANCDRVTVMRAGQVVATVDRAGISETGLIEMMIGRRLVNPAVDVDRQPAAAGIVVLELVGLSVMASAGRRPVDACTITVHSGEVVGVAGVAGNGQRELAEAIVGLAEASEGRLLIGGSDLTHATPRERIAAGIVYIPEDRIHDGILPGLSIAENLVLGLHRYAFAGPRFDPAGARELARRSITEFGIQAKDSDARAVELSGGNIQKLVVARAMALAALTRAVVLVAMNPTRGLDVRATSFVRSRVVEFARDGAGVLLISEDLDELLQLCERIVVMYRGRTLAILSRGDFDGYRIGALMAGTR